MPYVDPWDVIGPRKIWSLTQVEFSTGRGGWSVARGEWDGVPAVGIRWNGQDGETGPGNPQSRGFPTWFILPEELAATVMGEVARLRSEREGIECTVESPEEYSPGAWRVVVRLSGAKLKAAGPDFFFFFPKRSNEIFNADEGYRAVADRGNGNELGGQFRDGMWKGHLYTYDLRTKAAAVADEIREVIVASLKAQMA